MSKNSVTILAAACLLLAGSLSPGARAAGDVALQQARDELRLRTETERRMRGEFESLLADGLMSRVEIAEFEDYLIRLGSTVDEQRRLVATLEGLGSESASGSPRNSDQAAPLPADFDRGQTDEEKIALLDAELGNSLSEFDEKLLREQKEIAEKPRSASTGESGDDPERGDGVSANGQAGNGQGEKAEGETGSESGNSGRESAAGGTQQDGESEQQAGGGEQGEGAEGDAQVASADGAGDAGRHAGKVPPPPDVPDGKDDDIVARQLREAAENEQDPELREKLWEEYRKYKNRTP